MEGKYPIFITDYCEYREVSLERLVDYPKWEVLAFFPYPGHGARAIIGLPKEFKEDPMDAGFNGY